MKILSLNFGHDASITLFENGYLIDFLEIERVSRLKHHLGLKSEYIFDFLKRNSCNFDLIDMVALSGTQGWGLFHSDDIQINYCYENLHKSYVNFFPTWNLKYMNYFNSSHKYYDSHIEIQNLKVSKAPMRNIWKTPYFQRLIQNKSEIYQRLKNLDNIETNILKSFQSNFFDPLILTINGITKPGFYVDHHSCHAYYASYYSNKDLLIATHDGGLDITPFCSGGIYLSRPNKGVLPIASHDLKLGAIYDKVASYFDLDAGKMMGLSSYARANVSIEETLSRFKNMYNSNKKIPIDYISKSILKDSSLTHERLIFEKALNEFKFEFEDTSLAIQTAANAQFFVQEAYISLIGKYCAKICDNITGLREIYTTGGFSLNCPTNTELNNRFTNLRFIPLPAVGDTGISLGAAVALMNFLDFEIKKCTSDPAFPPSTLDHSIKKSNFQKLEFISNDLNFILNFLANELINEKFVCIHNNRSEVGPRALGRRSILSSATSKERLRILNDKKGRENWRPLAPICRKEDFSNFFIGDSSNSKYMLSISKVISNQIPAITHIDNTARVQILDDKKNKLYKLLSELQKLKEIPVLINTSFNKANEPIVETLEDAAKSFLDMKLDYLWTDEGLYKASM